MPPESDPGACRAKKGLLFLHDCGEPAIARCERCGRPVCGMHQVMTRTAVCCPECAAGQEQDESAEKGAADKGPAAQGPAVDAVRRRRAYYSDYDYYPYYYGRHSYFSDNDYRVFDEKDHVRHESRDDRMKAEASGEGDFGPDADLDNAMES